MLQSRGSTKLSSKLILWATLRLECAEEQRARVDRDGGRALTAMLCASDAAGSDGRSDAVYSLLGLQRGLLGGAADSDILASALQSHQTLSLPYWRML